MDELKKIIINIGLVLTTILIYILQANFFNWFTIAGIMPNLFVVFILFIGLFGNKAMGTIYGLVIGLLLDLLIGAKVGINSVCLGIIGFLATIFDKNFSKDSRMTIMVMTVASTVVFEVLSYILNYLFVSVYVELLNFIRILAIEVIYNLILTIVLYPLIQKFGYYIENEYKGNKILTKYF